MQYQVKRGDTVQKVAKRFAVEGQSIRDLNRLPARSEGLRSGASINLPLPTGYKRVIASMYDEKPQPARRSRRSRRLRRHSRRQSSSAVHRISPNFKGRTVASRDKR